jgi:hypothetical protein
MREPVKLEPQTQVFQNKTLASSTVPDLVELVGPPRDGSAPGITNSTPMAQQRRPASDPASAPWPATKSNFMYYGGKGSR